jgi:hypothetical protein
MLGPTADQVVGLAHCHGTVVRWAMSFGSLTAGTLGVSLLAHLCLCRPAGRGGGFEIALKLGHASGHPPRCVELGSRLATLAPVLEHALDEFLPSVRAAQRLGAEVPVANRAERGLGLDRLAAALPFANGITSESHRRFSLMNTMARNLLNEPALRRSTCGPRRLLHLGFALARHGAQRGPGWRADEPS